MLQRARIVHGVHVTTVVTVDRTPRGTVGTVDLVREERKDSPWAFSVRWLRGREKGRYSRYFTEADLGLFRLASDGDVQRALAKATADLGPQQLTLPYTEWLLIRDGRVVDWFETW